MRFSELLFDCTVKWAVGGAAVPVCGVTCNSVEAAAGWLFFCLRGARLDGHAFAADAYQRGCRHFVAETPLALPRDASILYTRRPRRTMARIAARYYGNPADGMCVIGITGTKGKTTTALMLRAMLELAGRPTAYIGSSGFFLGERLQGTENTTPPSIDLHRYLREARDMGVRTAVLEVSSQALATDRVHGIPFSVGIFTNVSRDHIGVGEHADMEEYVGAKLRLFTEYDLHLAVLNAADAISRTVLARTRAREILLFGKRRGLPFSYGHVTPLIKGGRLMTEFTLKLPDGRHRVCIPFAGEHYVQDYLGALASASAIAGVDAVNLLPFAEELAAKGRCETVTLASGALAVIDYAHNGASLAAALRGLRPYARGRLFCLFGAVGEHSSCRRADMARAASRYADLSVITEDNPGGEDPTCIVQEIYKAFPKRQRAVCMPDRGAAISYLASVAGKDDVILLAGKGDEEFQLRKEGKIPFSEKELLQKFTSR